MLKTLLFVLLGVAVVVAAYFIFSKATGGSMGLTAQGTPVKKPPPATQGSDAVVVAVSDAIADAFKFANGFFNGQNPSSETSQA